MKYKKGCTLLDQAYKEGEPTWGCKSGVLDVEDVEDFITQLKAEAFSDKGLEIGFIKLIEGMVGTLSD